MGIVDTVKGFLSYYLPICGYVCILPGLVLARIGWIRASGWWHEHWEARRQGLIKELLREEEERAKNSKGKGAGRSSVVVKRPGHAKKKSRSLSEFKPRVGGKVASGDSDTDQDVTDQSTMHQDHAMGADHNSDQFTGAAQDIVTEEADQGFETVTSGRGKEDC